MAKNIQIIRIQPMIIFILRLVISETKSLLLVHSRSMKTEVGRLATLKLNYLISSLINGRRKRHILSAQVSKLIIGFYSDLHVLSISDYAMVRSQSSLLLMGGVCDGDFSSLIAKYSSNRWKRVGNLKDSRRGHRAIANNNRIYVVGGSLTL